MKTFSEFTNISLLREILKNNTDKKVDYDSIQYDGNKLKFKTRSHFDGGIKYDYLLSDLLLTCLLSLIPIPFISLCPTITGLIIWGTITGCAVYFTNTRLFEHKPPFAILCTVISLLILLWLFTIKVSFVLEYDKPLESVLKLKEFYEAIPLWVYKFKF